MRSDTNKQTTNGFAPLIVIIVGVVLVFATLSVKSVFNSKQPGQVKNSEEKSTPPPQPTIVPTPSTQNGSPTLKPTSKPTLKPTNKVSLPTPSPTSKARELILKSPTPSPSPPDTTAPITNIYYPANNGSITYKIDGRVCAITSAPTDPDSKVADIETNFKYDDTEWSGFKPNSAYLCSDQLLNGSHTLFYQSKDKAGNTESIRSLNFTVQIAEN